MEIDRVDLGKAIAETEFERNLEKTFQRLMDQLVQILNGGLVFSDNFFCEIKSVTTDAVADAETTVAHTLKKVPTGYLILHRDKAGIVYNGSTTWTTTNLYIKSNVSSLTVKIMVF